MIIGLLVGAAALGGGFVFTRGFVRRRLRYVDAIQKPAAPWIAGAVATAVALPRAPSPPSRPPHGETGAPPSAPLGGRRRRAEPPRVAPVSGDGGPPLPHPPPPTPWGGPLPPKTPPPPAPPPPPGPPPPPPP